MKENDLDRDWARSILFHVDTCIWITIWIFLMQILGGLRCNNDWLCCIEQWMPRGNGASSRSQSTLISFISQPR